MAVPIRLQNDGAGSFRRTWKFRKTASRDPRSPSRACHGTPSPHLGEPRVGGTRSAPPSAGSSTPESSLSAFLRARIGSTTNGPFLIAAILWVEMHAVKNQAKTKTMTSKTAAREARRRTIAASLIAGESVTTIARKTGISRPWASQEANSPETQVLIADMLDKHADEMADLVARSLRAIRDAFGAKDGRQPDHRARLLAVKRVIELSQAGRVKGNESASATTLTWQQFLTIYQEATRGTSEPRAMEHRRAAP